MISFSHLISKHGTLDSIHAWAIGKLEERLNVHRKQMFFSSLSKQIHKLKFHLSVSDLFTM